MAAGLFAGLNTGCASLAGATAQNQDQDAPVCHGQADCTAKWNAARTWVMRNSAYDIKSATDAVIKTYGPGPNDPNLAAVVTKVPLGGDGYQIRIEMSCGDFVSCHPDARAAEMEFDKTVGAADTSSQCVTCGARRDPASAARPGSAEPRSEAN